MAEATPPEASEAQRGQISELVQTYGRKCKVINSIGDFSNVVEVKLGDSDCSIKFQLEGSYPVSPPHIIVKSKKLSVEQKEELSLKLGSEAAREGCTLKQLVNCAALWVEEKGLDLSISTGPESSPRAQRSPKNESPRARKNRRNKKAKSEDEVWEDEKLPSMKTAMDVVSRIRWDDSLPTNSFLIGYLDRHLGMIEKKFSAFSWEDISSVDYNTLAIPKHRIHYFKYKGIKVWDKSSRLDNVFGSTGSGITIYDVIAKHNEDVATGAVARQPEEDSDSDDDDIEINVGEQQLPDEEEQAEDEVSEREKYWGQKNRPTHFLCLRITDPEVKGQVASTHAQINDVNAEYADCIIPPERLHVTLACLGLDTPEQIERASDVLRELKPELEPWSPSDIRLTFRDVDHFHHSCVYARVHCEDHRFQNLVQHLRSSVLEAGIEIRDVFDFHPHMTIMKMKKRHGHEFRSRYLDTARLFSFLQDKLFGVQTFNNIHLCEMSEGRRGDGFYITPAEIDFPLFRKEDYDVGE